MLDAVALDECIDLLRTEHFYVPAHALIWEACTFLQRESSPVDIVTVKGRLEALGQIGGSGVKGLQYLAEIVDSTPSVANVRAYASRIVWLAKLRRAIALCQKKAAEGYQASADVPAYLDELETEVIAVNQEDRSTEGEWLDTLVPKTYATAQAVEAGEVEPGLSTGLDAYDELTGGLHDGDLIVLGARPGMGKTALALLMARNAAEIRPSAYFSAEMPKNQLTQRLLSSEASTNVLSLRRRGRLTQDDWRYLTDASQKLQPLPLYIDDTPGLTMLGIRSRARRVQSELRRKGETLGAIFVDYLQLLGNEDERSSREQQVARNSRDAKQMAKALQVPVVVLSSLNRDVEKRGASKRPQLSDLRESGQVESDADVILFIYRPGYYEEAEEARKRADRTWSDDDERKKVDDDGRTEIIIAKQRNGPVGSINLKWWGQSATFSSWEERQP
jgi:replicative DNA helicase